MDTKEFEREDRYAVIKYKKLTNQQWTYVPTLLEKFGSARVDCVVVESDWPEYHLVWAMLEHRIAGKPVPDFNAWRHSDELQQRLTAAEQRNAELDLEWSRTITDRGLIALELNKAKQLLRDVLDEVPHGWGESFSESDLADRIRQAIPMRFCDACEQYVEGPCSSWDCSTPEVENWTKPTESGASDKCASDGGTCGLGGHCGECPHIESGASE